MQEIAGVKRVDQRRMDNLREELSIQTSLMGRLMNSRMKWAGHVERMNADGQGWHMCPSGEGKEEERKTGFQITSRGHQEGGVGGQGLEECGLG